MCKHCKEIYGTEENWINNSVGCEDCNLLFIQSQCSKLKKAQSRIAELEEDKQGYIAAQNLYRINDKRQQGRIKELEDALNLVAMSKDIQKHFPSTHKYCCEALEKGATK